jgi:methyl-accepting chemotaxis protein
MFESLAGSDFQSIVNTWLDIFKKFGTNFEAAIDKINESIDDMIRNMVTQTVFVQPLMQRLNKYLQDYAANAGLDQDEFGNYIWTNEAFVGLADGLRTQIDGAKELYQSLLNQLNAAGIGLEDSASDRTASSRGFAQASQESIDDLGGRATAIQEDTASIRDNTIIIQQTVAAIYGSVQRIETNTEELHVIKNIMRDMQSRGMQLRSS